MENNVVENLIKNHQKNNFSLQNFKDFVSGFLDDSIDKKDATKFIWFLYNNKLTDTEISLLTKAMAESGEKVDLSLVGDCVDKHSTGGVSDTTTLVIVPVLASLGIKVAKMSGRSLGFTGGTADKLEVFKGYKTDLSIEEFKNVIKKANGSMITQSSSLAPADKKIYALRDEIGAVDNIALIASSIMSKKIACGCKYLLLDVKYGNGAFMKDIESALNLAKTMKAIGINNGINTKCIISSMNEPLSCFVGNNVEVYSALEVLNGKINNLQKVCKKIVSTILVQTGYCKTIKEANNIFLEAINSKNAIKKLSEIICLQGGSTEYLQEPFKLLPTGKCVNILASGSGYLTKINVQNIGNALHLLAKSEKTIEEKNKISIFINKKINNVVKKDTILAKVFYNSECELSKAVELLENSFIIEKEKIEKQPLINKVI